MIRAMPLRRRNWATGEWCFFMFIDNQMDCSFAWSYHSRGLQLEDSLMTLVGISLQD